jgi:putative heme-binding domain-containing protein
MNHLGIGFVLLAIGLSGDGNPGQPLEEALSKETPEALASAVRERGDAVRGAALFFQPSLNCVKCHVRVEGQADPIGPDLAKLGREVTDVSLIESVLAPSKVVKKGFETVKVATVDGKVVTGLLAEDRADRLVVRDPSADGKLVTILKRDVEQRSDGGPSIMPVGLSNGLNTRQDFLDLIRYLREIADGGPDRARTLVPDPSKIVGLKLPDYERDIDHAGMIAGLGRESLDRGAAIYKRVCSNCHGTKAAPGSLPTSLRFASGQFKNGNDPLSLYRTITHGFGQMPPQTWMVPSQKYDVIHYIRETYLKLDNPTQYASVDRPYLDRLPKGKTRGPAPSTIEPWSAMNYGPSLSATYEISSDESNFAYKGVAIRVDAGAGGVSRGHHFSVFDHDTMRLAASWTGDGFIDWNGINFNGQHGVHPRVVGLVELANPPGPGWAEPVSGSFVDPRIKGRDGQPYGPLPRTWSHFRGQYRNGDRVVLSYTVGKAEVLESPEVEMVESTPVFARNFAIGPRDRSMVLQVARRPESKSRFREFPPEGDPSRVFTLLEPVALANPQPSSDRHDFVFDGKTHLEMTRLEGFDMTGGDYSVAVRFQTRKGGTLFCETSPGDEWVHDGKSLFVRNGRLVFDIGWVGELTSARRVDDGAWHEAVLTSEAKTHLARLFIDGRPAGEKALPPHGPLARKVHRIGFSAPDFPQPLSDFQGLIAEVRLFNKALKPNEVGEALKGNDKEAGILARWTLADVRGDIIRDQTAHGFDARVVRKGPAVAEDAGILAEVSPKIPGSTWSKTAEGDLRLTIPAGVNPLRFALKVVRVPHGRDPKALARSIKTGLIADLATLIKGGGSRWPEVLRSSIKPGSDSGPFAVDSLGLPEVNPWLCQIRPTGFDFLPDGHQAAVCTWDGDVWLVKGFDAGSGELSWKRIASGLFQPLGLKVVDGQIFVGCRDQIVILRDLNGDGETDFYENFNNDHQVTEHFHEFAMDLQTDEAGNFYYAKAARHGKTALVPQHGTLLKVSRDGLRTEILATGFRAPNGVCVNDDGTFFLTDQEGFWTPKNRINHVKVGGFYGNIWGYHDVTDTSDAAMEPPVCWITNDFDRSPAEVVRVTSDAWGPLKGSLLNLSYGTGKVFVIPHETVGGVMQGGMVALPIGSLPTGMMRGRFHPKDGQLYALGMFAWASNQTEPGGFYRFRATGQPMFLPTALNATKQGLRITFTEPVDPDSAVDLSRYNLKTWSLKRSANYGSKHYDEKPLDVSAASVSEDGRTVSLTLPSIQPTQGMEIHYRLKGSKGEPFEGLIHNTIHRLAD